MGTASRGIEAPSDHRDVVEFEHAPNSGGRDSDALAETHGHYFAAVRTEDRELLATVAYSSTLIVGFVTGSRVTMGETSVDGMTHPMGEDVKVGKPQQGRRLSDDDLAAVAEVHTAAWMNGEPVNEAVRRAFCLTRDGTAKRISTARAAGLLEGIGPKR